MSRDGSMIRNLIRNYAELGRISNLPTILSNVMVGCAIGEFSDPVQSDAAVLGLKIVGVFIAIACLYIAGMALNDIADAPIDRIERPTRPIPSGRIARAAAARFAIIMLVAGLVILGIISVPALLCGALLVMLIVAYDLLHQQFAWSVVLLGACRGMVYVVAAASITWPPSRIVLAILAGSLTAYTIVLSIVARSENNEEPNRRRWLALALPLIAVAPVPAFPITQWLWIIPALVMIGWLARSLASIFRSLPRTRHAIMAWLAGICLLDALDLTLLDFPLLAFGAFACFIVTLLLQKQVLGT